ncbi:alpha/beta fold hydrolase [Antrihabitans sp. YC3-6]|uniref:Alpha/beta fold hydrolase n=1 Tax=Antrihabitans stalagmiti TaxID=2799499 RepID=A0A934U6H3_9NOCA|nr:alpha/beta hydrolase [Antrihabitans stalagmiti]MBJ8342539.1 alpha/beta fold hydrolase [Antrihabitans stalagmiti]
MKKTFTAVAATVAVAALALTGCGSDTDSSADTAAEPGRYASVNGLNMYYEVHGEANGQPPLVLLHGGLSATGTSFGQLLPGLAEGRQVISIEQQAHGHTADIDRPVTIATMADDTLDLLDQIGVEQADFFGYSIGAGIALEIEVSHPEKVRKAVLATVSYNTSGMQPGMTEGVGQITSEMMDGTPFKDEFVAIAPHPDQFDKTLQRMKETDESTINYTPEQIKGIQAPTLIIAADNDIVTPEHTTEMYRLLGGGIEGTQGLPKSQLAVIPGTSHITLVQQPAVLLPIIGSFLDAGGK